MRTPISDDLSGRRAIAAVWIECRCNAARDRNFSPIPYSTCTTDRASYNHKCDDIHRGSLIALRWEARRLDRHRNAISSMRETQEHSASGEKHLHRAGEDMIDRQALELVTDMSAAGRSDASTPRAWPVVRSPSSILLLFLRHQSWSKLVLS